jgi:hypothetical protein
MRTIKTFCVSALLGIAGLAFSAYGVEGWSALNQLDEAISKVENLDAAGQRAKLSVLTAALDEASSANAPKAFRDNLVAHFLIGDMESVNTKLKKPETLSDKQLTELTGSLHPLLETLLKEMKVPHVCSHAHHKPKEEHGHDHDHGHDH